MQPIYVTQLTTTPTFKAVDVWSCPQQISWSIISTGGSSWALAVCYEDPSFAYPSPQAVTGLTSTIQTVTLASSSANALGISLPSSMAPISGFSFNVSTAVTAGSKGVTCVCLQVGPVNG
jgi:hypothetical protein